MGYLRNILCEQQLTTTVRTSRPKPPADVVADGLVTGWLFTAAVDAGCIFTKLTGVKNITTSSTLSAASSIEKVGRARSCNFPTKKNKNFLCVLKILIFLSNFSKMWGFSAPKCCILWAKDFDKKDLPTLPTRSNLRWAITFPCLFRLHDATKYAEGGVGRPNGRQKHQLFRRPSGRPVWLLLKS